MKSLALIIIAFLITPLFLISQDKGHFIEYKNEYWEEVSKSISEFEKKEEKKSLSFKVNYEGMKLPKFEDFKQSWHNDPVPQASTGTCWCFCATSFLESEIFRVNNKKIKMSEMFTVYWQYVEKARRFVRERGNSVFGEGAQANAVKEMWKQYGCVPAEAYSGMLPGQKYHSHSRLFYEMNNYLQIVKETSAWNEEEVVATIKSILNHYLGVPPTSFKFEGKEYSPKTFISEVVKLNMDDYVDVMSLYEPGYWKKIIYRVPDNWWFSEDYHNVPLEDYMNAIKKAVKNGLTMAIGGDVSEAGLVSQFDVAMVPTFDIPSEYINDMARQFRFSNNTTTDDHGIHIVGYKEENGKFWFLIKDSGSGARNGKAIGYYFYHEDYVKLKMMSIFIHKSPVQDLITKCK
jgi:bleomycin hydrolase